MSDVRDDLFSESVGEVLVFGIAAKNFEGQNDQGVLVCGGTINFVNDGLFLDPKTKKNTGLVQLLLQLAKEADEAEREL